MKKLVIALLAALLALGGIACAEEENALPVATIEMEDGGVIVAELYPDVAPNTVANFIELANAGFYDGLIFHRVIAGFMIQGGDPTGTGMGGPGYTIAGEFDANGFENTLSHTRGVLSMARAQHPDSAGSQFFIMHADYPALDGQYAAFGQVTEGIEVVDAIATTATDASDRPVEEQVIKSIRVDTHGVEYVAEKLNWREARFDALARRYPYPVEVEGEAELMRRAKAAAQ